VAFAWPSAASLRTAPRSRWPRLSRMQLADRVLCSENYIYRLESSNPGNRRVPSPWVVDVLSEALRLNGDQGAALLEARDRLEIDTVDMRDRLRPVM
jgi:Helix-turn-helix domain